MMMGCTLKVKYSLCPSALIFVHFKCILYQQKEKKLRQYCFKNIRKQEDFVRKFKGKETRHTGERGEMVTKAIDSK